MISKKKIIELETELSFFLVIFLHHESKNTAIVEPRTGQFLELVDFEAKAKDLSFEFKDFKKFPRGLHLCEIFFAMLKLC